MTDLTPLDRAPAPHNPVAELIATLTPEEAAQLDTLRAELRGCRYVEIPEHGKLRPGGRVYHRGHRWPEAAWDGTGTVLALTERRDSSWSRTWGMPDIEMVVLWDTAPFGSRVSQVAQYHVYAVDPRE